MLALPLVLAGVGVIVSAVAQIGDDDVERDDPLVTDGPYAWTRNPMYVGWGLIHVGVGMASGSGWVLAAYPAAALAIHREILREERRLRRRFGRAFGVYADAVPRYLPVRSRSATGSAMVPRARA